MSRLFRPAVQIQKKVKLVAYGDPGTGKTLLALSFPRVAFIDMEGSADLYTPGHEIAGWGVIPPYDILHTKTLADVMGAIEELRADRGRTWDTLIIDPATVLNQVLQDAGQVRAETRASRYGKSADEAAMTDADWGTVKRKTYSLMTDLVNLPVHVILTAHLREVFETRKVGGKEERVKVGVRPDAEKKTTYWADFVFELQAEGGQYSAVCKKERGGYFKLEQRVPGLHYSHFLTFIQGHATGVAVTQATEADAARLSVSLLEDATPKPALAAPQSDARREYARLYAKLIDLGLQPTKDGKALPAALPERATDAQVGHAVEFLRALVVQAEDMSQAEPEAAA